MWSLIIGVAFAAKTYSVTSLEGFKKQSDCEAAAVLVVQKFKSQWKDVTTLCVEVK